MILNAELQNITSGELLGCMKKGVLITPNVDQLIKLQRDREFYELVQKAEWVVCDSKILYLFSKLLRYPLKEAIPGSGFFPSSICITRKINIAGSFCWELWMEWPTKPWRALTER